MYSSVKVAIFFVTLEKIMRQIQGALSCVGSLILHLLNSSCILHGFTGRDGELVNSRGWDPNKATRFLEMLEECVHLPERHFGGLLCALSIAEARLVFLEMREGGSHSWGAPVCSIHFARQA